MNGDKRQEPLLFAQQWDQVKNKLFAMALVYLKQYEDAEDVIQETAYAAYRNYGKLKSADHFDAWITSILMNQCHKLYRRKAKHTRLTERLLQESEETGISPVYSGEEQALMEAVHDLPEKLRQVVLLKYFSGYKISDIAGILKIPEGTVKSRLHNAVRLLKERMEGV